MMKKVFAEKQMGKLFNFIDLFAGAGGLSCGLEMAGHHCLLGVDHDKNAMKTFAHNHPMAKTYCGDIRKLTKTKLVELTNGEKVELIVGGPPCQGFSTVGPGNPKDERNHLFRYFLKAVEVFGPKFIIMENVTGLLAQKNQKTLDAIIKSFDKLGYQLVMQVVSMEKYGVPERRRRTIILGGPKNIDLIFPEPTHEIPVTVGDVITDLKSINGKTHNHDIKEAALKNSLDEARLKCIPEGKSIRYQEDEELYLPPKLRLKQDYSQMKENRFRQAKYYRLNRMLPSPTILTNRCIYYHPTECRYLTPREAAKLQGFPNDFVFTGSVTSQWRQIGNAVPPILGKVFGEHLKTLKTKKIVKAKTKTKNNYKSMLETIRSKAFIYKEKR